MGPMSNGTTDHQHAADHGHDHHHADDGKPRIGFIGAGRVGTALAVAFSRAEWEVTGVASRDEARRSQFRSLVPSARAFEDASNVLDEADLIFLTVPDDAIASVAEGLHLYSGQALVHTSGALPASVLTPAMAAGTSKASFHPLVAFADLDRALEALQGATVALDGDESLLPVLADMAESIGARPVRLPEGGKAAYHAAAMMAAGGLIGLLDGIVQVAQLAGLDEKTALAVYLPLARQALANSEEFGVDASLTGPFARGDVGTVRGHLDVLRDSAPEALDLYVAVARRELAIARRRGRLGDDAAAQLDSLLNDADSR